MTVNDRIRLYLDNKGISYPEAERIADMGRYSISRGSNITAAMLCKFISTYTDVSYEWLLTGDGAMLKDSASKESDQKRKDEAISDALRTNETDSIHIDEAPVIDSITDVKLLQFIAKLYYNYVEKISTIQKLEEQIRQMRGYILQLEEHRERGAGQQEETQETGTDQAKLFHDETRQEDKR